MSVGRTLVAGVMLASASTTLYAFQEQRQGSPAAVSAPPAASVVEPAVVAPSSVPPPQGTEIRIPGLGRVGTLPKLDFGMELLYGAQDQRQPTADDKVDEADGVMIRGSVKHKF